MRGIAVLLLFGALALQSTFVEAGGPMERPNPGPSYGTNIGPGKSLPPRTGPGPSPGPGGPGPGGPPTIADPEFYLIAVCAGLWNIGSSCLGQIPPGAVEKVAENYARRAVRDLAKEMIRERVTFLFPQTGWIWGPSEADRMKFLQKIEKRAIDQVKAQLKQEIAALKPFEWDSEQDKALKQDIIEHDVRQLNRWEREAKSEAENPYNNWSEIHFTEKKAVGHYFDPSLGNAYRQLQQVKLCDRRWDTQPRNCR